MSTSQPNNLNENPTRVTVYGREEAIDGTRTVGFHFSSCLFASHSTFPVKPNLLQLVTVDLTLRACFEIHHDTATANVDVRVDGTRSLITHHEFSPTIELLLNTFETGIVEQIQPGIRTVSTGEGTTESPPPAYRPRRSSGLPVAPFSAQPSPPDSPTQSFIKISDNSTPALPLRTSPPPTPLHRGPRPLTESEAELWTPYPDDVFPGTLTAAEASHITVVEVTQLAQSSRCLARPCGGAVPTTDQVVVSDGSSGESEAILLSPSTRVCRMREPQQDRDEDKLSLSTSDEMGGGPPRAPKQLLPPSSIRDVLENHLENHLEGAEKAHLAQTHFDPEGGTLRAGSSPDASSCRGVNHYLRRCSSIFCRTWTHGKVDQTTTPHPP
ncbi:hypothetical protein BDN72DRAFT_866206 [Pluteus cervinus]|uniref:Uncharacterized protein n=1 Tax=Pluteus cervinus TaxID=181527 RepID=A0ACD2ZY80_9AGAR|nr:hypothetical protein BDN72DRAFT_866206 [Pluteus cervinus]